MDRFGCTICTFPISGDLILCGPSVLSSSEEFSIHTLNFSRPNVSLTWKDSDREDNSEFLSFFWLQRNERVALTYTIWTSARPWKAPAPIFLLKYCLISRFLLKYSFFLRHCSILDKLVEFIDFSTYRICSWSSPLKVFGPTEERWL